MGKRNPDKEMGFLDHLEELRWHILKSMLAIIIFAIAAFIFKEFVFDQILLAPRRPDFWTNQWFCYLGELWSIDLCINQTPMQLVNINMSGQFSIHIWVSIVAGIIAAFPFIFREFWSFVSPALYPKEKSMARSAIFVSSLLFLIGILFGYYIILPLSLHFFSGYMVSDDVPNMVNIDSYVSSFISVVMSAGIIFELPIVIYFLSKVGLVGPKFLRTYRKHAIVVILTIAAIITPPDVFSQLLVSLPLLILYEISIFISAVVAKKGT